MGEVSPAAAQVSLTLQGLDRSGARNRVGESKLSSWLGSGPGGHGVKIARGRRAKAIFATLDVRLLKFKVELPATADFAKRSAIGYIVRYLVVSSWHTGAPRNLKNNSILSQDQTSL